METVKNEKAFKNFTSRVQLFAQKNPEIIINTLSNIFSMRIIGNKTHGDLAEIGISEFINQFMYDFTSVHVGKDLYRSKKNEEDISVKSLVGEFKDFEIPISLKAYGDGPLQLSTDKEQLFFSLLEEHKNQINTKDEINKILNSDTFKSMYNINVMPLIYDEKNERCNIMIFDIEKAFLETEHIYFVDEKEKYDVNKKDLIPGKGRKHPIFLFTNSNGEYIFEIRYGDASANALQRGVWTHTKNAINYFISLTNGWINYKTNTVLVKLISLALNATKEGHEEANEILQKNIDLLKNKNAHSK